MAKFQEGQTVMYENKEVAIDEIDESDNTYRINNPLWNWDDEAYCTANDEDYQVPYWLWVQESELSEKPTQMIWYKCATCGNGCLDYTKPTNDICGGCDKPDWRIAKYQQAYKAGSQDWQHPDGEI